VRVLAGRQLALRLLEVCGGAERSVCCAMYVVRRPYRDSVREYGMLWGVLKGLAARGVRCELLLDGYRKPRWHAEANRRGAALLVAAGWRVRVPRPGVVHHAKLWLVDGSVAIVGSHNLTEAAMKREQEVSVELRAAKAVRAVWEYWAAQWVDGVGIEKPRARR
jgi:phosphatidylserine/phosphatidylglycerophosphate/cardiolipin synthase-like enzyme